MLLYISLVLSEWEKDAEKAEPGSSLAKGFRYPPVLPMILYDGKGAWTAQRNFFERTHLNTVFGKYIPKFEYEVINLNDYSEEEIMRFGGALSYIFLIDKIRNNREKDRISRLPADYVEKLRLQIPDDMHKLLVDVTLSLLDKSGYNRNEAEAAAAMVEKAGVKEYDGMFEVAIESLREEREEALAEGRATGIAMGMAKGLEEGREAGREEGRAKEREEIARNALEEGASFDFIQKITGLDMETIERLSSGKN